MGVLKEAVRSGMLRLGYRVTRVRPQNRFQAMDEVLLRLRNSGFQPRVVIDAGANVGQWARLAQAVFPGAEFHLIEPQPGCATALHKLAEQRRGVFVHAVAATAPGVMSVHMVGGGDYGRSTGAWVADSAEPGSTECPATTLDALLADRITPGDRCLCKLDLEGHELRALSGASRLLANVEVLVTEVQFFDINGVGATVFAEMLEFLRERGFELYDFAALTERRRDGRLQMGDAVFVRSGSPLATDLAWT
jgi:FkbM family methyltransferase